MKFGKNQDSYRGFFCAGLFKPPHLAVSLHIAFLEKRRWWVVYRPRQNSNARNHSALWVVAFALSKMQVEWEKKLFFFFLNSHLGNLERKQPCRLSDENYCSTHRNKLRIIQSIFSLFIASVSRSLIDTNCRAELMPRSHLLIYFSY